MGENSGDNLAIMRLATRRLAVPMGDVDGFLPAARARAVEAAAPWLAGVVWLDSRGAWLPIVDLATLWRDPSLAGSWTCLVATGAGLALGCDGYETVRAAAPLSPVRPALRTAALARAIVLDGQAVPVLDVYSVISAQRWHALGLSA
jgi:hypothetical protein